MHNNSHISALSVDPELKKWIRDIRRHLHNNPELSFEEHETAAFIQKKLAELNIESTGSIAKTGVVATLPGNTADGHTVALRADMDALPISEETGLVYGSKNPGVMHACGHDGHVAMLLGAAALLRRQLLPGAVKLLFQPAEEYGNGAMHMMAADVLENVEAIFAGHIDTHIPLGTITVDEGIVCAWADPFHISLRGRSGHAARPHEAVDTVVAAANLVLSAQTLISRGVDPNRSAVVSIGHVQAGTAQNIIAQDALLRGTVRSTHKQTRMNMLEGLSRMVESIGLMHGVEANLDFHNCIPAVENNPVAAEVARAAAVQIEAVTTVTSQGAPSLGAEDFAFYLQKVPGCMVRFGAALEREGIGVSHSGRFDFNEDVLSVGASWYANVAWQWLRKNTSGPES